jgi:hypothetical protein
VIRETELAALLESQRERLQELPGVIGSAVGRAAPPHETESAVHLYVTLDTDADEVRGEAERLLSGARVEVIAISPPEAQAG